MSSKGKEMIKDAGLCAAFGVACGATYLVIETAGVAIVTAGAAAVAPAVIGAAAGLAIAKTVSSIYSKVKKPKA